MRHPVERAQFYYLSGFLLGCCYCCQVKVLLCFVRAQTGKDNFKSVLLITSLFSLVSVCSSWKRRCMELSHLCHMPVSERHHAQPDWKQLRHEHTLLFAFKLSDKPKSRQKYPLLAAVLPDLSLHEVHRVIPPGHSSCACTIALLEESRSSPIENH